MTRFEEAQSAIASYTADTDAIDRVAIRRDGEIQFCVSPTTWWGWRGGKLVHHYALDDEKLPLSQWARERRFDPASVLAYRPGRRLVLLDRAKHRVLKGYRVGKASRASCCHQLAGSSTGGDAFRVPQLLELLPKIEAIALGYCDGQPFRLATASHAQHSALFKGLVSWQKQSSLIVGRRSFDEDFLGRWGPFEELDVLEAWTRKLSSAELALPADWTATKNELERNQPFPSETVFVHRDLHDGQVLFDGRGPVVLDFDQLALGDPAVDLGNLLTHTRLRELQYPGVSGSEPARSSADELLSETTSDAAGSAGVSWYSAATFLRLALVYSSRPRWRHLVPQLVRYAKRAAGAAVSSTSTCRERLPR